MVGGFGPGAATVEPGELRDEREPDAGPGTWIVRVPAVEGLEHALALRRGDTRAIVDDLHAETLLPVVTHPYLDVAAGRVLGRVLQQVGDDALDLGPTDD